MQFIDIFTIIEMQFIAMNLNCMIYVLAKIKKITKSINRILK